MLRKQKVVKTGFNNYWFVGFRESEDDKSAARPEEMPANLCKRKKSYVGRWWACQPSGVGVTEPVSGLIVD